jgi:DUF917 family protein
MGHVYGEVIIEGLKEMDGRKERFKIPFKNENILAVREEVDGTETVCALITSTLNAVRLEELTSRTRFLRLCQILSP